MKILAVDDERLVLNLLIKAIAEVDGTIETVAFQSPKQALEYSEENFCDAAFLDVSMREMNGLDLAKQIKSRWPSTYIVFVTGYSEYAVEAIRMHVSGYLLKPVTVADIREQLEYIGNIPPLPTEKRFRAQTFGNFEFFIDGKPCSFACAKAKELLAYLIDRKGAAVSVSEAAAVLYENSKNEASAKTGIRKALSELYKMLRDMNAENLLIRQWSTVAVDTSLIGCDYYMLLDNDVHALNAYTGEYMSQYSWGELTLAGIKKADN